MAARRLGMGPLEGRPTPVAALQMAPSTTVAARLVQSIRTMAASQGHQLVLDLVTAEKQLRRTQGGSQGLLRWQRHQHHPG